MSNPPYHTANDDQRHLLSGAKVLFHHYLETSARADDGDRIEADYAEAVHHVAKSLVRLGDVILPRYAVEEAVIAFHNQVQPLLLAEKPTWQDKPVTATEALAIYRNAVKTIMPGLPTDHPSARLLWRSGNTDGTRATALGSLNRARRYAEPSKDDEKVALLAFRLKVEATGKWGA